MMTKASLSSIWVVVTLLTAVLTADAQQATKVPRIGFLSAQARAGSPQFTEAFLRGLRELGYIDGQNIAIEYRWAGGKFERLPELAADLVRVKVDVIVAVTTPASLAAKKATSTIPIVMTMVSDPVDSGLIASLARPGANITGISVMTAEITGKQFGLLRETLPKISRMAALWNPANPMQTSALREVEIVAKKLGVTLQELEARDSEEIVRAFAAITKERTRALHILVDPLFIMHRKQIADLALKHRLPAVSGTAEYADAGLLMSYGASFPEAYHRTGIYVDKILKGAKPADLPVERPMKFEFVINLNTANQIGLTIPQWTLMKADRVIR